MMNILKTGLFLGLLWGLAWQVSARSLGDFTVLDIDGKASSLKDYHGKVVLVVNTASRCGFTPQYEGLEALYQSYKDRGLVILAFPSNDFLGQEPGSDQEIKAFCTDNYAVSFPLFAKIKVGGNGIDPLYRWLTSPVDNPRFAGKITWNFNKFLIDRKGQVIGRFDSAVKPQSTEIIRAIEAALLAPVPLSGQ